MPLPSKSLFRSLAVRRETPIHLNRRLQKKEGTKPSPSSAIDFKRTTDVESYSWNKRKMDLTGRLLFAMNVPMDVNISFPAVKQHSFNVLFNDDF